MIFLLLNLLVGCVLVFLAAYGVMHITESLVLPLIAGMFVFGLMMLSASFIIDAIVEGRLSL